KLHNIPPAIIPKAKSPKRCFHEIPATSTIPNQIVNKIIAEPKSGWAIIRKKGIIKYNPVIKICLIDLISTCLRARYFAKIRIKIILINSDGWKDRKPKLNQLVAPLFVAPTINNARSNTIPSTYKISNIFDCFKKEKSS